MTGLCAEHDSMVYNILSFTDAVVVTVVSTNTIATYFFKISTDQKLVLVERPVEPFSTLHGLCPRSAMLLPEEYHGPIRVRSNIMSYIYISSFFSLLF